MEIVAGLEQRGRHLRYIYNSRSQPKQVFEYDLETRERMLLKVEDVPSGHDPSLYVTRRIFARPTMARRCPSPCSIDRMQARRVRTGLALRLVPAAMRKVLSSEPSGCRWWIEALSTPSLTCAVAGRGEGWHDLAD